MGEFHKVKEELSVSSGVVPVVMPKTLTNTAVDLAHVEHQGIVKQKSLIPKNG